MKFMNCESRDWPKPAQLRHRPRLDELWRGDRRGLRAHVEDEQSCPVPPSRKSGASEASTVTASFPVPEANSGNGEVDWNMSLSGTYHHRSRDGPSSRPAR